MSNSPYDEGEPSGFGANLLSVLRSGAEKSTPEELAETVSPEGDGTLGDVSSAALPEVIDGVAEKYESGNEPFLDVRAGVLAAVQLLHEQNGARGPKPLEVSVVPDTEAVRVIPGRALGLEVARAAGATPQAPPGLGAPGQGDPGVQSPAAPEVDGTQLRSPDGHVRVLSVEVEAAQVSSAVPAEGEQVAEEASRARTLAARAPELAAAAVHSASAAAQAKKSSAIGPNDGETSIETLATGVDAAMDTSRPALNNAPVGFRAPITQAHTEAAPLHARPALPEPAAGPGEGRALPPRPSSVVLEITPEGHGEPIAVRVRVFGDSASARILRADPAVAQALMEGEGELVRTLEQAGFREPQLTRSPDLMIATAMRGEGAGTPQGGERGEAASERQRQGGGTHQQHRRDERDAPETFLPDFREALES